MVALGEVAAEGAEFGEGVLVFDAFGDDAEVEAGGEAGDAVDEGAAGVGVGGEAGDEGPVDLEFGDGKALKVGQAGVTGAEIVQREGDSWSLQGRVARAGFGRGRP